MEEILPDMKSNNHLKLADKFLQTIVRSPNRKKILVHFKIKGSNTQYREWLSSRQYNVFRTISCLEFCKIVVDKR